MSSTSMGQSILDFRFWILDLDCVPAVAAGFWIVTRH